MERLSPYLKILLAIIFIAFVLRIIGIAYGLPLWLVSDEPPFILAALTMIEIRTLLPVLAPTAFNILYFSPYLSYLFLIPFIPLLLFQYLSFSGDMAHFGTHLLLDLSPFFFVARVISALLGS